ncbi:MAG TPA: hypothetical protein VGO43_08820 [Pyrinomonadaceae bacterium]|jgi:hypothetical protein|nr:hypothetical protein [Pyrinomonadaceae bacterium]
MTPKQTKKKLLDLGLTVADLASELHEQYPDTNERSLYTMVDNMVWGRNYYPRYALYLNTKYGFQFERPAHMRPVRELLKAAA